MTGKQVEVSTPLTIGFAGMTHLGLISATACAAQQFRTVGFDGDAARIDSLRQGDLPIEEPGLRALFDGNRSRLHFTSEPGDLGQCDVVYISSDVPTDSAGISDLASVRQLLAEVVPALRRDAVLVVLCQVPPGFTRSIDWPGIGGLYYQVETLVFGQAVERALKPERFIVGCAAPEAGLEPRLAAYLKTFGCPILPMRYESAELSKIAINFCLVASIGVANTLAEVSEVVGADWSEVVPALKLDRRIGPWAYLHPGLGIAGGNLERDLRTILELSRQTEIDVGIVDAWIANSEHRRNWALDRARGLLGRLGQRPRIAVWGLAYKENTNSTKNSPSLFTISQLPPVEVVAHDPVVSADAVSGERISYAEGAVQAVQDADMLMILTPWPEYRAVPVSAIAAAMRGRVIIDPYGVLRESDLPRAGFEHHIMGKPPAMPHRGSLAD